MIRKSEQQSMHFLYAVYFRLSSFSPEDKRRDAGCRGHYAEKGMFRPEKL